MAYLSPGVYVEETPSAVKPIAGVGTSTPAFVAVIPDTVAQTARTATGSKQVSFALPTAAKTVRLLTNWSQFTAAFGDFLGDGAGAAPGTGVQPSDALRYLQHAVFGFFNNGGSRCYVVRAALPADLPAALAALAPIEDISLVLAPGATDDAVRDPLVTHCQRMGDRFAILDGPASAADLATLVAPKRSDFAAWYFPWIKVFDPVSALVMPAGNGLLAVPPSGHVAGIYARVDNTRGVHKAPANEAVLGALGLAQALSKADQEALNPKGVNAIRSINGNLMVWGARTTGGDDNADLKYINVRRTLLFLRKSIEQGTQWVVFEPNTPDLWQRINRSVTGFLTTVWRSGALFGTTAKEAFYVRCDAETNPEAQRANGMVVTEIGVALARPAEFVVFRISQMAS